MRLFCQEGGALSGFRFQTFRVEATLVEGDARR